MAKSIVFILAIGSILSQTYADLPPDISKCKAGETVCIAKKIMEVLKKYPKGNSEFGLPPVDKLVLNNIQLSQSNQNGPVQLEFKLGKAEVFGFEKAKVDRVVGFEEDLDNSKFEVYAMLPNVLIKGDYEALGRILLLPLNGKGDAEIKLKNVKCGIKAKVGKEIRNGKRFAVVKKTKVQLEPELMQIRLDNLFNGNQELGQSMNQLINDNWKDIWNELGSGINKVVEKLLSNLLKEVLKDFSYDDFYKKN